MKIFCSGIGGIGLSAYAAVRKEQGHAVSGSDRAASDTVRALTEQGIDVALVQDGAAVPDDCELFVYSEAIPEDSPERMRASALGIPQQSYFEALGALTRDFQVIAVAGTHGKSSTTAMAARVLIDAGLDPSVVVGTKMKELSGRNWRLGAGRLFVVEACEYRRSFHALSPHIILLTNADGDHFDYYASQEEYVQAFVDFVRRLPPDGLVITHGSDDACVSIARRGERRMIDADGQPLPPLSTPGLHMQQNAQLVLALADELRIDHALAMQSLAGFQGTWRRMELRGQTQEGALVIDDYGHHPTEIRATIAALKGAYPSRRLVVVFQPHTHDRTLKLYADFTKAFTGVDLVIVPNVYDARRERDSGAVDVPMFVRDIARDSHTEAVFGKSLPETARILGASALGPKDVLLTLGAGDVTGLAGMMLAR